MQDLLAWPLLWERGNSCYGLDKRLNTQHDVSALSKQFKQVPIYTNHLSICDSKYLRCCLRKPKTDKLQIHCIISSFFLLIQHERKYSTDSWYHKCKDSTSFATTNSPTEVCTYLHTYPVFIFGTLVIKQRSLAIHTIPLEFLL